MANIKMTAFKEDAEIIKLLGKRNYLLAVRYRLLLNMPIGAFYKQFKKPLCYE